MIIDEVIAQAIAQAQPGDTVIIHAETCAVRDDEECDCEPLTLAIGAAA